MAEASSGDYDWNAPCLYYFVRKPTFATSRRDVTRSHTRVVYEDDVTKYLSEKKFNHGDLVNFGDYRQTGVKIVTRNEKGELSFIQNPDDFDAGYMTIPREILTNVTDAMKKYAGVIDYLVNYDNQRFSIHLTRDDVFIRNKFGDEVPGDLMFILELDDVDVVRCFYVKKTSLRNGAPIQTAEDTEGEEEERGKLHEFDWDTVTLADIMNKLCPDEDSETSD